MKKTCALLTALFIIAAATVLLIVCLSKSTPAPVRPEVLNVGTSEVTIAWLSEKKYKGRVNYKPAAAQVEPSSAVESFRPSNKHEVAITGLSPSTRYTYRIGDSETRFQFQTQPYPNTPFSFIMVWGDISQRALTLMMDQMPEFIVWLCAPPEQCPDQFADLRPYVPIYGPQGPDSVFLKTATEPPKPDKNDSWKLDWGGLRLVLLNEGTKLETMLNVDRAHTIGIITRPEILTSSGIIEAKALARSPIHSILIAHNKKNPTKPAAFVGLTGRTHETAQIDGIVYFTIPAGVGDSGAVRIDIDVESASAHFIDQQRTIALKQPPLKERRTCEQCRRLADNGAYEQSVKAYEEFIATHQGHFQIDDAYFAIAEIYDEKLFRFPDALKWYNRLTEEYPAGTLTPLAKQRVKYLSAYSDHNFEPLARFERIRKIEFARRQTPRQQDSLLQQVDSLITEYPDCKLAGTMQYWLANQYRQANPDKAVEAYRKLREKYPHHDEAEQTLMDVGRTYYDAERYAEAISAYKEALTQLPSLEDAIKAQITRCKRNMRRIHVAFISWAALALIIAASFFAKPAGIKLSTIILALPPLALLVIMLSFGGWLIKEQFSSPAEMLLLVICFSGAVGIASMFSTTLTDKIFTPRPGSARKTAGILPAAAGSITGLILFIACIYLAIYYINVHYLIVVGM